MQLPELHGPHKQERDLLLAKIEREFAGDVLAAYLSRLVKAHTVRVYKRTNQDFFHSALRVPKGDPIRLPHIHQITSEHVDAFLCELERRPGRIHGTSLTAQTRSSYLGNIRVFFNWLRDRGLKSYNPAGSAYVGRKIPHERRNDRAPRSLEADEVSRLLEAALSKPYHGFRDFTLLMVLLLGALRNGEVIAMTTEYIERRPGGTYLLIPHAKGGDRQEVLVPDVVADLIEHYRHRYQVGPGPLWINDRGETMYGYTLLNIVARSAVAAGIERGVTTHHMRHTSIMHALDGEATTADVLRFSRHQGLGSLDHYIPHSKKAKAAALSSLSKQIGLSYTPQEEPERIAPSVDALLNQALAMLTPDDEFEAHVEQQHGGDLIPEFLNRRPTEKQRPRYRNSLRLFAEWFGLDSRLTAEQARSVTTESVRGFQKYLRSQNYKPTVERLYLGDLQAFFRWALDVRVVSSCPVDLRQLGRAGLPTTTPIEPLSWDEFMRLLEAANGEPSERARLLSVAVLLTLLFGALSKKELLSIDSESIRPHGSGAVCTLDQESDDDSNRVYLPAGVRLALENVQEWKDTVTGPLWDLGGTDAPFGDRQFKRLMDRLASRAEVERNLTATVFRKTFLQFARETGADEVSTRSHMRYKPTGMVGSRPHDLALKKYAELAVPEVGEEDAHVSERVWDFTCGSGSMSGVVREALCAYSQSVFQLALPVY